jgi:hypothetical protein
MPRSAPSTLRDAKTVCRILTQLRPDRIPKAMSTPIAAPMRALTHRVGSMKPCICSAKPGGSGWRDRMVISARAMFTLFWAICAWTGTARSGSTADATRHQNAVLTVAGRSRRRGAGIPGNEPVGSWLGHGPVWGLWVMPIASLPVGVAEGPRGTRVRVVELVLIVQER